MMAILDLMAEKGWIKFPPAEGKHIWVESRIIHGWLKIWTEKEGVDGDPGGSEGAVDAPGEAQPEHGEISGTAQ